MAFNVLIPLDGSRLAERSLAFVPALARMDGFSLKLVSVVNPEEDVNLLSQPEAVDRESNVLRTYLDQVAEDLRSHHNLTVETELIRGNPGESVLTLVQRTAVDLLVISTHGRSGIARWRMGSVADKLVRGANCDTLVIGPHAADTQGWIEAGAVEPFKRIMVPADGSERAEQALARARHFAGIFASELHIVRVINLTSYGGGFTMEASYTPQLIETLEEAARQYVARLAAGASAPGGVKTQVLVGSPASALEEYATGAGVDLVVMTSHGRGGLARAALGSVTDRLLGGAAPVLVVRAE